MLSFRSLKLSQSQSLRHLEGFEDGLMNNPATQIVARYSMGYWPAKLTCVLNLVIMVGYTITNCIIAGQILSAVSGGSMSVVVGIIITALISWLFAVFGMAAFQAYERYVRILRPPSTAFLTLMVNRWAWIPQLIVFLVLAGIASRNFDTSSRSSGGSAAVSAGRLTFFSLSLCAPVSWAAAASDYYVYVSPRVAFSPRIIIRDIFAKRLLDNSSCWTR